MTWSGVRCGGLDHAATTRRRAISTAALLATRWR